MRRRDPLRIPSSGKEARPGSGKAKLVRVWSRTPAGWVKWTPRDREARGAPPTLRLTVDMVPRETRGKTLQALLPAREWQRIRDQTFELYGKRCWTCGYWKRWMECHEVWEFDEEAGAQRLLDVIPLCRACHGVKHWVTRLKYCRNVDLTFPRMIRHFLAINQITPEEARAHLREMWETQQRRDSRKWRLELKWRREGKPLGPRQLSWPW